MTLSDVIIHHPNSRYRRSGGIWFGPSQGSSFRITREELTATDWEVEPVHMNLITALKAMKDDGSLRLKRISWSSNLRIQIEYSESCSWLTSVDSHQVKLSVEELMAEDWIVEKRN